MTQKELAEKLNITDKAISKWERGQSCPDISFLAAIAEIFGVTTSELLNGERKGDSLENAVDCNAEKAPILTAVAGKSKAKSKKALVAGLFSVLLLVGMIGCAIPDMAISQSFTWSLFPMSSILFAWFLFFPVVRFGEKGIVWSLLLLSVLIVPFLYLLSRLIGADALFMNIGIRMSILSVCYLWLVFALFWFCKKRRWLAAGISSLLGMPFCLAINFCLARLIPQPIVDVWDILTFGVLLAAAIVFFIADFRKRATAAQTRRCD